MKIRTSYIGNSSSSPFIIAYDSKTFGNLGEFLINSYLGYNTEFKSVESAIGNLPLTNKAIALIREKVSDAEKKGLDVIALRIDNDYECIIDLIRYIGKTNEGSIEIIYNREER